MAFMSAKPSDESFSRENSVFACAYNSLELHRGCHAIPRCVAVIQLCMLRTQEEPKFDTIAPKILYFGNPVALISSVNEDGTPNLAPISSFWALGWTMTLGLLAETKTLKNLQMRPLQVQFSA